MVDSASDHDKDDKSRFIAFVRPCKTCPELNLFFIFASPCKKDTDREKECMCESEQVRAYVCERERASACVCVRVSECATEREKERDVST